MDKRLPTGLKGLVQAYMQLTAPYRIAVCVGVGMILLTNLAAAYIPSTIKTLLNALSGDTSSFLASNWIIAVLLPSTLLLFALAVGQFVGRFVSRYLLLGSARRAEVGLRAQLVKQLFGAEVPFVQAQPIGDLLSKLTNDLTAIRYFLGGGTMLASNSILAYATRLPFMWGISPLLTVITLICYPLGFLLMVRWSKQLKAAFLDAQTELGQLSEQSHQVINGWQSIVANHTQAEEMQRFRHLGGHYLRANYRAVRYRILLTLLTLLLSGFSLVLLLGFGAPLIQLQGLSVSDLVAFSLYLEQLAWPTLSLGWLTSMVYQAGSALDRIANLKQAPQEALEVKESIKSADLTVSEVKPRTITAISNIRLEADKLSFAYPAGPIHQAEKTVWHNLSFVCEPGSVTAIVGPVASGKSTLLKVLAGFYPPRAGRLLLTSHGKALPTLETQRRYMALLPQKPYLFSMTLAELLAYGSPEGQAPSEAAAEEALRQVGLWQEVQRLPARLHTRVGPKGHYLSGGQRQRLLLAQAILSNRKIWLLDDPFSAVDGPNEQALLEAIRQVHQERKPSLIIATHRESLLAYADQIIDLVPLTQASLVS